MPAYAGAYKMRDCLFKLGGTAFTNQLWVSLIEPDTPTEVKRTLVPDGAIADADSPTWTFKITGLQDHEAGGLADFLWDNAGLSVAYEFAPKVGSGKAKFTGMLTCIHPPIGGEQGEWSQFELELPVSGNPVKGTQA